MTKDAQNALKRIMERYAENVRFLITCNDRFRIIHPFSLDVPITDSIDCRIVYAYVAIRHSREGRDYTHFQ